MTGAGIRRTFWAWLGAWCERRAALWIDRAHRANRLAAAMPRPRSGEGDPSHARPP